MELSKVTGIGTKNISLLNSVGIYVTYFHTILIDIKYTK